jgi:arabinan endo-1,5-alpha-L-arabinosidase
MKKMFGFYCAFLLLASAGASAQEKWSPEISGPYRILFQPQKYGDAINDHTVFQDREGNFRMVGILSKGLNLLLTPSFAHGVGTSLSAPLAEQPPLFADYPDRDKKWAPHVIVEKGIYHLYAGPGKIRHYTSPDGINWTFKDYVIKSDWPNLRDTMVIKIAEGKWLMYATDRQNSVTVFESTDLDHWTRKGTAFKAIKPATVFPKWEDISACESPFVIFYQGYYYLSVCLTTSSFKPGNYINTVVVRSKDPYNFGVFAAGGPGQTADYAATLKAHCAELIRDQDGNWFITSAGWREFPIPKGTVKGTLSIAPIKWVKQ